ncbi:putative quinol monooxygenase [Bradyrhizobium sp. DASA03005]|uniref:putative quinol monooxygenase n=1 Tax=Bradyrhizobium TaxID=374 RepID=UPI001BA76FC7|nr:antibiotic biosynthesis monooxygenase [Bradyrhizobium liaoningense]MBR1169002.1 antibiotic biosynthesis monooxygenase [Bradyrhizobium liaoningense]
MVTAALFVRIEAQPGSEAAVEKFLKSALPIVEGEPATISWFGLRLGPSTFGIFDAFPNDAGRNAHLAGNVAAAFMSDETAALLTGPATLERIDVLAAKLPSNGGG